MITAKFSLHVCLCLSSLVLLFYVSEPFHFIIVSNWTLTPLSLSLSLSLSPSHLNLSVLTVCVSLFVTIIKMTILDKQDKIIVGGGNMKLSVQSCDVM